ITIGVSPVWRMRLAISAPLRSGSPRSRITRSGFPSRTAARPRMPVACASTSKPASSSSSFSRLLISMTSSTTITCLRLSALPFSVMVSSWRGQYELQAPIAGQPCAQRNVTAGAVAGQEEVHAVGTDAHLQGLGTNGFRLSTHHPGGSRGSHHGRFGSVRISCRCFLHLLGSSRVTRRRVDQELQDLPRWQRTVEGQLVVLHDSRGV